MTKTKPIAARGTVRLILAAFIAAAAMISCAGKTQAIQAGVESGIVLDAGIGYEALSKLLEGNAGSLLLLDVRTAEEYAQGHIPGSVLHPYDAIAETFREAEKNRPIVVYCRSGRRSALALETLKGLGYGNVSDFGGIGNWKGKLEP